MEKTDCQMDGLSGSSADDPGQEGRWRAKRETGSVWGEDEGSHIKVGGEAGTGGGRSTRGLIPRGRVVVVAVSVVRDQSWARFRECCARATAERNGPWRGMLGRDGASGGERERERLRAWLARARWPGRVERERDAHEKPAGLWAPMEGTAAWGGGSGPRGSVHQRPALAQRAPASAPVCARRSPPCLPRRPNIRSTPAGALVMLR